MIAPFPYFGGKREIADVVWSRLGSPKQYIEPFCGSAAVLLAAPAPAALEVVSDINGFIANFWRAVKMQPGEVANEADYPVSHVDLGSRHQWLMLQRDRLAQELADPNWPGDAKVAGWWLWGQCCWIGSGWCEWEKDSKVPHVSDAGRGVQAIGQVPHVSDAGRGIDVDGQVPAHHIGGVCGPVRREHDGFLTSSGRVAWAWLHKLAARLERVRVFHGAWNRCLNNHFGGAETAIFLDPPYRAFEGLYGAHTVADEVCAWAMANAELRIALCGHIGDYNLPGWAVVQWKRPRLTYSGSGTTDKEAIWFSPPCLRVSVASQEVLPGVS
jgi:DNA adenine methylase